MPFLDHLEELRWRIIYAVAALIIGIVIGFVIVFQFPMFEWVVEPVKPYLPDGEFVVLHGASPITILMQMAFVIGLSIALPVILYQVWAFLSPALHSHERNMAMVVFGAGFVLFVCGGALAFFGIVPATFKLSDQIMTSGLMGSSMAPMYEASQYFGFLTTMILVSGLAFEVPLLLVALSAVGILPPKVLAASRKWAVLGIFIGASVVTPGDALTATLMLAGPLYLLYELSVAVSWAIFRRKERRRMREMAEPDDPAPTIHDEGALEHP